MCVKWKIGWLDLHALYTCPIIFKFKVADKLHGVACEPRFFVCVCKYSKVCPPQIFQRETTNEYFLPRTKVYFCIKNCLKLTPKGDNYYILTSFMWANPSIQASNKPGAYFFFLHTLEINYALYVINDNGRTKEEKKYILWMWGLFFPRV